MTASRGSLLSVADRALIHELHHSGLGVRGIAARIGCHPSTVSRELRRNRDVVFSTAWPARHRDSPRPSPRPAAVVQHG